jgi:pyruvate dehydrogenase E1 component beta subunit
MLADNSVILIGEGVPDPKAVFGSTQGLQEEFGKDRVFDMPVSENGMTGVCIGAAIKGLKPILVHQRIDFALYSMDQLVNNAAKWHSMYGGKAGKVPMVIRAIIGRGWGQGNQHSQNLSHLFAMIPGLKVVVPSNAKDAKELLLWAVKEPNPVLFIEHRWLHNTTSYVQDKIIVPQEIKAKILESGNALTLVAWSYMTLEALKAHKYIQKYLGINIEVIDMRSLSPLDIVTIKKSVNKTKKLLVLEEAWSFNGLSGEIITQIVEDDQCRFIERPQRINLPNCYAPSTPHLAQYYYPTTTEIISKILKMLKIENKHTKKLFDQLKIDSWNKPYDVPDQNFKGPF